MSNRQEIDSGGPSWWQTGVIYQIYPRSFQDTNGDGVGDLQGIVERLDYLRELGVDAIWLSPFYPSPMADFGYDVSDYTNVHPLFGTLDIFDQLVSATHDRGMKLIVDFVPNHTSDQHPWFMESRSSRTNPKRDWYIWRDPAPDGGPPNNWVSAWEPSAWTYDERAGQYYLHLFDTHQPDLNWRNPEVRAAMYDAMRFWLDRGVDGFRVDVIWMLLKDEQFRDNPPNPNWQPGMPPYAQYEPVYTADLPEVLDIVREMRAVVDEYPDRVLIGEIYLPIAKLMRYYGESLNGAHLPFNFQLVLLPTWDADSVRRVVDEYEGALPAGAWPNWVLGNHDVSRVASRVGADQARVAQMLLLTLRGTPTMYYGDELAMHDVRIPEEMAHDPQGKRRLGQGRDPERTPMQWNSGPNAGFCAAGVEPWLPLADDYRTLNVEVESADPRSMLSLVRELLRLRRAEPALSIGSYHSVDTPKCCYGYIREHGDTSLLVLLNFCGEPRDVRLTQRGEVVLSTEMDGTSRQRSDSLTLRANEGCVIRLDRQG